MTAFQPEVFTEEEVTQLLTELTVEEVAKARHLSSTPLTQLTLFEGVPGTAIVRDVYPLPRLATAQIVRYGLYRQLSSGEFQNECEFILPVDCTN
ncbi:MAG: hypothetical protein WBB22_09615 [Anaerolineae bacterium]